MQTKIAFLAGFLLAISLYSESGEKYQGQISSDLFLNFLIITQDNIGYWKDLATNIKNHYRSMPHPLSDLANSSLDAATQFLDHLKENSNNQKWIVYASNQADSPVSSTMGPHKG